MKKFILLISMMLCINQIKSSSLIGAARGVAGSIATSHPVITCTGLGLWVAMSGFTFYKTAQELVGRNKEVQREIEDGKIGEYFNWNGDILVFSKVSSKDKKLRLYQNGKLEKFTQQMYEHRNVAGEEEYLSPNRHRYTLATSGAIAALSMYGIYRTLFS